MAGKGGTGLGVRAREGTGEQRDTEVTRTFGDCHLFFAKGGLNWQCWECVAENRCTWSRARQWQGACCGAAPGESGTFHEEEEEEGWSRSQGRGSGGEGSAGAILRAARPPLCFTHLHLGAVLFSLTMCQHRHQCVSTATSAWDGVSAGCDALSSSHRQQGQQLAEWGRETCSPPKQSWGWGLSIPLLRATHPHASPKALSLSRGTAPPYLTSAHLPA